MLLLLSSLLSSSTGIHSHFFLFKWKGSAQSPLLFGGWWMSLDRLFLSNLTDMAWKRLGNCRPHRVEKKMINSKILAPVLEKWCFMSQQGKHYEVNNFWIEFTVNKRCVEHDTLNPFVEVFLPQQSHIKPSFWYRKSSSQKTEAVFWSHENESQLEK
jgi:hypothetical protein